MPHMSFHQNPSHSWFAYGLVDSSCYSCYSGCPVLLVNPLHSYLQHLKNDIPNMQQVLLMVVFTSGSSAQCSKGCDSKLELLRNIPAVPRHSKFPVRPEILFISYDDFAQFLSFYTNPLSLNSSLGFSAL